MSSEPKEAGYPDSYKTEIPQPSGRDLLKGLAIMVAAQVGLLLCARWIAGHLLALRLTRDREFMLRWALQPESTDYFSIPLVVLVAALTSANMLLVSWYFVCRKYRVDAVKGFALHRPNRRVLIWSVLLGLTMSAVGGQLLYTYGAGESTFLDKLASTPIGFVLATIGLVLAAPIEEACFRGFIFPVLRTRIGPVRAILFVSIVFALLHASGHSQDLIAVPMVFVAGAVFAYQRHVHESLVPPIVTHLSLNATAAAYLFAVLVGWVEP